MREIAPILELSAANDGASDDSGLSSAVERHLRTYFVAHEDKLPAAGLYQRVMREIERPLFHVCLEATEGNQVQAAALLGLNRNTLRKKLSDLGMTVQRDEKRGKPIMANKS